MKYLAFLALVAAASAHLCMISPPQRGSMSGLNTAGSSDCILLKAPCGGRPQSGAGLSIPAERNFTVTIQKNLDHWLEASPGYFSVDIALPPFTDFKQLVQIPDMGEPSLHLYSVNITVPGSMTNLDAVIRSQYVTNNPNAPSVFYQCADVFVN
ncbi:uncharacterized protein LOC135464184 isoform X2 [Liolophura sinensis]|uniref:uncharacterized protein LOC135464184 isoform X2 n=1 Tax=Liolophura sinensis TaxID=3198878 RepID=UPI0031584A22